MNKLYFLICFSIFSSCVDSETNELRTNETEILNLALDNLLFNSGIGSTAHVNYLLDSTLTFENNQYIQESNERLARIKDWKNDYLVLIPDSELNIEFAETKDVIKEYLEFEKLSQVPIRPFNYRKSAIFKKVLIFDKLPNFKKYQWVKVSDIYLSKDKKKAVVGLERLVSCFSLEYTYFLEKVAGHWIINFRMT